MSIYLCNFIAQTLTKLFLRDTQEPLKVSAKFKTQFPGVVLLVVYQWASKHIRYSRWLSLV